MPEHLPARTSSLQALSQVAVRIARRRYSLAIAFLVTYKVLISGLGTVPREPYRLTALDPFNQVTAHPENYFQRSPLLPLIGHFTGLTSPLGFAALSLALVLAGWLTFTLQARRQWGNELAVLAFALVLSHPVSLVLISWLGTPDGISFALTALLMFVRSAPAAGLICALGAFNHPAMNIIAPTLLALRLVSEREQNGRALALGALGGLLAGNLAVVGFLQHFDIDAVTRTEYLRSRNLSTWVRHNLTLFPYTLYSLHQPVWFALAACVPILARKDAPYLRALLATHLVIYAVTFFSTDTTRIFSLLGWAPAIHCVSHSLRLARGEENRDQPNLPITLASIATVGLLIPGYYMWAGELHTSSFNSFYRTIRGLVAELLR